MESEAPEDCVGPDSENAGRASACEGCPHAAICRARASGGGPNPMDIAFRQIQARLTNVKRKIIILSGKGGVGKSTFAAQLALMLASNLVDEPSRTIPRTSSGDTLMTDDDNPDDDDDEDDLADFSSSRRQIGLLDVDLCGPSMPTMFSLDSPHHEVRSTTLGWQPVYPLDHDNLGIVSIGLLLKNRDSAVVWRGPKKNGLIVQFLRDVYWGDDGLDYLLIDTPPGTSDEHITVCNVLKSCCDPSTTGAVLITTPQEVACLDVRRELTFCKKLGIRVLGIVENMSGFVCPSCGTLSDVFPRTGGGGRRLAEEFGVEFLGSVPLDPRVMQAGEDGESVGIRYPESEAAVALKEIARKVMARVGDDLANLVVAEEEEDNENAMDVDV